MSIASRFRRTPWRLLAFAAASASIASASVAMSDLIAVLAPPAFHLGWTADAVGRRWGPPDHTSSTGDTDCRHLTYAFEETRLVYTLDAERVVAVHMIARTSDRSAFDDADRRLVTLLGPPVSRAVNRVQWDTARTTVVLGGWRGEFNVTVVGRGTAAAGRGRSRCHE